jgi:hypothetical protein
MAKTLLNAVNETLKRVKVINSNGELTTLTNTGKQSYIDIAVQVINETIDQLFRDIKEPRPSILTEATITLVTSDRDYALATDLTLLHYPLLDRTNGQYITEYPGGYMALSKEQSLPDNYTGLPMMAAIRPTDGELYLDRIPTSEENGKIYTYQYSKDTELSILTDEVPFTDIIFRALIPAFSEKWKLENKKEFNGGVFKRSIGTAAGYLRKTPQNSSWLPTSPSTNNSDPYA